MEKVGTFKDMMQCGTSVKLYHPKFWAGLGEFIWSLLKKLAKNDARRLNSESWFWQERGAISDTAQTDDFHYRLISDNTQT
jgi:hypothetical protein